jgi:hypothetical protein
MDQVQTELYDPARKGNKNLRLGSYEIGKLSVGVCFRSSEKLLRLPLKRIIRNMVS